MGRDENAKDPLDLLGEHVESLEQAIRQYEIEHPFESVDKPVDSLLDSDPEDTLRVAPEEIAAKVRDTQEARAYRAAVEQATNVENADVDDPLLNSDPEDTLRVAPEEIAAKVRDTQEARAYRAAVEQTANVENADAESADAESADAQNTASAYDDEGVFDGDESAFVADHDAFTSVDSSSAPVAEAHAADLLPETATDAAMAKAPTVTAEDRLRSLLGLRADSVLERRIFSLTHAITIAPGAAVNYVLRGEAYLDQGHDDRAADDFHHALVLAETELTERDHQTFGIMAQSLQDRALAGYETALRRMTRKQKV